MNDIQKMASDKGLRLFLLIAFAVAWVLFLTPLAVLSADNTTKQAVALIAWTAAMWAPGLGAIIATARVDRAPLSTLRLGYLGERRIYLWAWLLPPLLVLAAIGLTVLLGAAAPDWQFTSLSKALEQGGSKMSVNTAIAVQMLSGLLLGPVMNVLPALGEELGWRAYLLPKLLPLGQLRAILISGAIWGVWHAPVILMGRNYPDHPVLGVFLMVPFTVLFGAILAWFYLRTRSPWAPALGHASLNAFAGLPLLLFPKFDFALAGTLTSLIGWVPMGLFIAWLVWSKRLPAPPPEEEDVSRETI